MGGNLNTAARFCSWKPGEAGWIFGVTPVPRADLWHWYFREGQNLVRVACTVSLGCSVPACVCRPMDSQGFAATVLAEEHSAAGHSWGKYPWTVLQVTPGGNIPAQCCRSLLGEISLHSAAGHSWGKYPWKMCSWVQRGRSLQQNSPGFSVSIFPDPSSHRAHNALSFHWPGSPSHPASPETLLVSRAARKD
uniref:Uncharacterized protein n=1 Tax=Serinus canaria TaxID=9135 RepID=A0A8C9UG79_SERCA